MKKIIMIVSLVVLMLFLTACGEQQTETTSTKGAFLGGTEGVTAKFEPFGVEEDGKYTIFETETFPIEVNFNNKGEHDLKPGDVMVKLLGPSKEEFSGISTWELKNKGNIEKKSDLVENGGEEVITFASDAKYTKKINGVLERDWFANIEYNYKTYLIIPEVCLKEDLTDTRICEVKGVKEKYVSGAPVTVESVEEDTAGKGIMALKIKVKRVGNGKVTKPGDDFGVNERLTFTIDDSNWECKSGGKIGEARLLNGEATIICKLKNALSEGTLSTKQIRMTFDYKYRDLIKETLRLKESSE